MKWTASPAAPLSEPIGLCQGSKAAAPLGASVCPTDQCAIQIFKDTSFSYIKAFKYQPSTSGTQTVMCSDAEVKCDRVGFPDTVLFQGDFSSLTLVIQISPYTSDSKWYIIHRAEFHYSRSPVLFWSARRILAQRAWQRSWRDWFCFKSNGSYQTYTGNNLRNTWPNIYKFFYPFIYSQIFIGPLHYARTKHSREKLRWSPLLDNLWGDSDQNNQVQYLRRGEQPCSTTMERGAQVRLREAERP